MMYYQRCLPTIHSFRSKNTHKHTESWLHFCIVPYQRSTSTVQLYQRPESHEHRNMIKLNHKGWSELLTRQDNVLLISDKTMMMTTSTDSLAITIAYHLCKCKYKIHLQHKTGNLDIASKISVHCNKRSKYKKLCFTKQQRLKHQISIFLNPSPLAGWHPVSVPTNSNTNSYQNNKIIWLGLVRFKHKNN